MLTIVFLLTQFFVIATTQEACTDRQPEEFSCEQQARWGKCERPWMQNYCDKSCGRCSDNQDLDCSLATSLECDRIALLQFKSGMSSEAQELLSSWSTENPCSGWKGIICRMVVLGDSRGLRVNRIRLGEFNWENKFNLWSFEANPNYVPEMDANFPKIIPQNMVYLEELSLWNSGVKGNGLPLEMSRLEDLQVIALGYNNFDGSLPKQFSTWGDVEVVELEGMGLAGSLPQEFSTWSQLRAFNTRFNNLTGRVPSVYTSWASSSRPISMQGFFVEQDDGICTSEDMVSQFTNRASLATDITSINICQ